MSHDRIRRANRAFTLIELLVVIGIIALLLAILLPTLSKVRASAKLAQCASTQRSMGQILVLIANDHDGYMPLAGHVRVRSPDGYGRGLAPLVGDARRERYWYIKSPNPLSPATGEWPAPLQLPLLEYATDPDVIPDDQFELIDWMRDRGTELSQTVLGCPEASPDASPQQSAVLVLGNTTIINSWPLPFHHAVNEGVFGFSSDLKAPRLRGHLSRVSNSSDRVLLGDALTDLFTVQTAAWIPSLEDLTDGGVGRVTLADVLDETDRVLPGLSLDGERHDGRMNILFADGHVETLRINNEVLSKAVLADLAP